MIPRIFFLLLVGGLCRANPIANAWIEKTGEHCDVKISQNDATVACVIDYHVWEDPTDILIIEVPIYVPNSVPFVEKALRPLLNCKILMGDKSHGPTNIRKDTYARKVEGAYCVSCVFEFPQPPSPKRFQLGLTYRQPLIRNRFYYLAQFEVGPLKPKPKNFLFTALPASTNVVLQLRSENDHLIENSPERIRLNLEHWDLIAIEAKKVEPSDAANSRPAGTRD